MRITCAQPPFLCDLLYHSSCQVSHVWRTMFALCLQFDVSYAHPERVLTHVQDAQASLNLVEKDRKDPTPAGKITDNDGYAMLCSSV